MILNQCPHCKVKHVQTTQQFVGHMTEGNGTILWFIERCQNNECKKLVLVTKTNKDATLGIFPFTAFELDSKAEIPQEIVSDFREAGLCLGASCPKASMVMSRRVLQRCLHDQGCTQNRLVDAINSAVENNILRKAFHPLANEIRQYGNLGAHPDDDQLANANRESAHQILEFARLLIHEFYEVPATAETLRNNREMAKNNTA